jgi:hypothetical protein
MPGENVQVLAPPNSRLRGLVTRHAPEALTIALEQSPIREALRFTAGHEVEVEWVHSLGVMQVSARVAEAQPEHERTLELELLGHAEPVERREHERHPVELEIWAWTLAQPTKRLKGHTLDLSASGARLHLIGVAPAASLLELTIVLPDRRLHVSAAVRWRREPALVGVQFQRVSPDEQASLVEFLRQPR